MTDDLRYPIGPFEPPSEKLSDAQRLEMIDAIADAPMRMRAAVHGLHDDQLETPYRPGGWTVRQVVHHVSDSHINAYVRFRLALTEDNPTVRPYTEALWAELPDARSAPIEPSLTMLDSVHDRLVRLLRSMYAEDFDRPLFHPENGPMTLNQLLALYAWHGSHHASHVTALRERHGW